MTAPTIRMRQKRRLMTGALYLGMIVSALWDLGIRWGSWPPVILVKEVFLEAVFSGILTFTTLSLTVLSMIIDLYEAKTAGLHIKKLLTYEASPLHFRAYFGFSVLVTLSSVAALTWELYTLMGACAVGEILFTYYAGSQIFGMIADDSRCIALIREQAALLEKRQKEERRTGPEPEAQKLPFLTDYCAQWLEAYCFALQNHSFLEMKQYARLLQAFRGHHGTDPRVRRRLVDLLDAAGRSYPWYDAFAWVLEDTGYSDLSVAVYKDFFPRIRDYSLPELKKFDLTGLIRSLVKVERKSEYREKSSWQERGKRELETRYELLVQLLEAVIKSEISDREKGDMLARALDQITDCSISAPGTLLLKTEEEYPFERQFEQAQRNLQKDCIVFLFAQSLRLMDQKDSRELGEALFLLLVEKIWGIADVGHNLQAEVIASVYLYCVLYSFRAWAMDKDAFRKMAALLQCRTDKCLSLAEMARSRWESILAWYGDCALRPDPRLERLFAQTISGLDQVWSPEQYIGFAYQCYLAWETDSVCRQIWRIDQNKKTQRDLGRPLTRFLDGLGKAHVQEESGIQAEGIETERFVILDSMDGTSGEKRRIWELLLKEFDVPNQRLQNSCEANVWRLMELNRSGTEDCFAYVQRSAGLRDQWDQLRKERLILPVMETVKALLEKEA